MQIRRKEKKSDRIVDGGGKIVKIYKNFHISTEVVSSVN